jgi:hypothetical protein
MELDRPLLYLLKESKNMKNVFYEHEFINEDDCKIFENVLFVPRISEYIWIYQKLTLACKRINEEFFNFQISGFGGDLHRSEVYTQYTLNIDNDANSVNKLNVIVCTGECVLHMNHDEYTLVGRTGTLFIFPAFLWFRIEGSCLLCVLSGDHFH